MRTASNTLIVVSGIALVVALVVFLAWHIRRSAIHSAGGGRRTRLAANEALRRRLETKVLTGVGKRTQELERTPEGPRARVGARAASGEQI